MEIITSKITSKGQVTVPKKIRDYMNIHEGDLLSYEVRENSVVMRKILQADMEWAGALRNTLSEWEDNLDDEL